jgi:5-methylcytosine-specific restriction endonuclease McrA
MIHTPCLVLNASFEALCVTSVKRAIKLVMTGKAVVEEPSDRIIHAGRMSFPSPSIIRLLQYRRIQRPRRVTTRRSIMLRDQFCCQYCGLALTPGKLTLDHIIPRARGGTSIWENLVAACSPCNHKKGDRTPEEAGMRLLNRPGRFTAVVGRQLLNHQSNGDPSWKKYLFC